MLDTSSSGRSFGVVVRSGRRLFRDSLVACLAGEPELEVFGHAACDDALTRLCRVRPPDIVLYEALEPPDDEMTTLAGLAGLRQVIGSARLLVLYERLDHADLVAVRSAGVDTWYPTSHGLEGLLLVLRRHVAALRASPEPYRRRVGMLTDQEREVIALTSAGHTAQRTAELLGASVTTVENCRRRIYQKLRAVGHGDAVATASALGLTAPSGSGLLAIEGVKGEDLGSGTKPLVVLRGPDGPTLRSVMVALLAVGVPFVHSDSAAADDRPVPWQTGRAPIVLVEPGPSDWAELDGRTPVILVRSLPSAGHGRIWCALDKGVVAVLGAHRLDELLGPALTLAMAGHLTLDQTAAADLTALPRIAPDTSGSPLPELTCREGQILRSIASGHTIRQTARALGIAAKTVENTQARLFRKLGAHNRAGAVSMAYSLGLLADDG